MLKKITSIVTLLVFAFSMIAAAPVSGLATTRALTGRVVAIDSKTHVVIVSPVAGKFIRVKVTATTQVKRQGRVVSFSRLRVGDKTSLHYDSITRQVSDIDDSASVYEIHGTVEAVDTVANTIVVASEEGGNSVKLIVNTTTVIDRNGAVATLADLVVGDKVEAKYTSATMIARLIKTDVEDGDFKGTIAAMTVNTVTVTPDGGGANVVLKVVASTVFISNNVVIAITGLHVGDPVEAAYDLATLVASKVEVDQ